MEFWWANLKEDLSIGRRILCFVDRASLYNLANKSN